MLFVSIYFYIIKCLCLLCNFSHLLSLIAKHFSFIHCWTKYKDKFFLLVCFLLAHNFEQLNIRLCNWGKIPILKWLIDLYDNIKEFFQMSSFMNLFYYSELVCLSKNILKILMYIDFLLCFSCLLHLLNELIFFFFSLLLKCNISFDDITVNFKFVL